MRHAVPEPDVCMYVHVSMKHNTCISPLHYTDIVHIECICSHSSFYVYRATAAFRVCYVLRAAPTYPRAPAIPLSRSNTRLLPATACHCGLAVVASS